MLFGGSLDGAAADASGVSVHAPAGVTFQGPVGGAARLTKLSAQNGTTVSGGLINTQADQTFLGPVTFTQNGTQFTSAAGPIVFSSTLNADTTGNKNLTVNAGTGTASFQGAVGGVHAPQLLEVAGNLISAPGAITSSGRADFTVGTGGMTQGAGASPPRALACSGPDRFPSELLRTTSGPSAFASV